MKTAEEILKAKMDAAGINFMSSHQTFEKIIEAMEEYSDEVLKNAKVEIRQMTNSEILTELSKFLEP